MILAYTGTPGSGKSYHAAADIWERVKFGHPVITNMLMVFPGKKARPAYVYKDAWDITPEYLREFSEEIRKKKGWKRVPEDYIYLVIDEAQLLFNCRDWNAAGRREWTAFFQLHRKLGYHIILITQMAKMLDKQVWGLLEYEIIHRKFSNFGLQGTLLSLALLSPTLFACVRMWSALRERVDCQILRYSPRIGRMYNTGALYLDEPEENGEKPAPVEGDKKKVYSLTTLCNRLCTLRDFLACKFWCVCRCVISPLRRHPYFRGRGNMAGAEK